jgi:hypothetical protein
LRNSLIIAIVASLGLAACSSGGPQTVPVGSQAAPLSQSGPHLVAPGFQRDTSCPSKYAICFTLKPKGKTTAEVCISSSGNCTSGIAGDWTWTQKITTVKGKKYSKIKVTFKPNPGNPVDDIFKLKKTKSSHGKVAYVQDLTWCAYPSPTTSCNSAEIGLIIK